MATFWAKPYIYPLLVTFVLVYLNVSLIGRVVNRKHRHVVHHYDAGANLSQTSVKAEESSSVRWVFMMHVSGDVPRCEAATNTWFQTKAGDVGLMIFGTRAPTECSLTGTCHSLFWTEGATTPFEMTRRAFESALRQFPNATFFAKFDDDTYVYTRELIRQVDNLHRAAGAQYYGYPIRHGDKVFGSGGAGYVVSRTLAERTVNCTPVTVEYEDVGVSECVSEGLTDLVGLHPHHPFRMLMWDKNGHPADRVRKEDRLGYMNPLSYHYMPPGHILQMHDDIHNYGFPLRRSKTIPHFIHQFWVGERKPGAALQKCKDVHVGWQYQLWNQDTFLEKFPSDMPDVGMPVFDGSHGKLINQDLYDRPDQPPNLLSDIMRFEVVLLSGGVYIDADSECLRPLDHFINEVGNAQGFGFLEKDESYHGGLVANGFIGMFPLSPLAITLVSQLQYTDWSLAPWQSAGPLYFTKVLHWFRDLQPELPEYLRVRIFESHHVYPYHYSDSRPDDYLHQLTQKGAIADQKWGTTQGNYQKTEWIAQRTAPSIPSIGLIENYVQVHRQGLSAAAVRRPRWVVASLHPHAGACNRMMHIVSCLAFAMATGRTLLFDWDGTTPEKHANGIEDMGHTSFHDLFQVRWRLAVNISIA